MNNNLIELKVQQRLNKLASHDYDNIEWWQIAEAFNKVQVEWVRRQLSGNNARREGEEQTTRRVDDLEILLVEDPIKGAHKHTYFETAKLPARYLAFSRVSAVGYRDCCPPRPLVIYDVEERNIDLLNRDANTAPSFEWGEALITRIGNRLRIHTLGLFGIDQVKLTYYRMPRQISRAGEINLETGGIHAESTCEFKKDIAEILIDETAALLAGDLENMAQTQRGAQSAERNN